MKTARVLLIVVCGLGLLTLAGCGCGKVREVAQAVKMANDARDGKMTVTNEKGEKATIETKPEGEKAGKITVTGEHGTTTTEIGTAKVSEADLGVDFYPGAAVETGTATTATGKENAKYSLVGLVTSDSFADVAKFYKDKYGQGNTVIEQPNHLMITIKVGEHSGKMIMVASEDGKTKIVINAASSSG